MKMRHRKGDVLFREGDPSDFACRILSGEVEVVRDSGGGPVTLGRIGAGDIVGEMGVIERKPRSATVIAASDVEVDAIPAESFFDRIASDPPAAERLLTRLSERVRELTDEVVRLRGGPPAPPAASPAPAPANQKPADQQPIQAAAAATALVLVPAPEPAPEPALPLAIAYEAPGGTVETVLLTRFPFQVGRTLVDGVGVQTGPECLRLPERAPHRLSLNHFSIDRDPKLGLVVRDTESELGTMVNGQYLGGIFCRDRIELRPGPNHVIAGGLDSPFRFVVTAP